MVHHTGCCSYWHRLKPHMATTPSTLSYAFPSSSSTTSCSRFLITTSRWRSPTINISTEEQPCSSAACHQGALLSYGLQKQRVQLNSTSKAMRTRLGSVGRQKKAVVRCSIELEDFIGGDLIKLDLGKWLSDVEEHKAIAIYSPHEGGYEGRYLTRLRYQGYQFLDLSARGLGDPETTLTKFHPVCPAHVGKQPIARWYFPPEVDYRLSLLPPNAKGLVVWIIEAKVLSKAELQFLALLPTLRPQVRVIAECGNWRKFMWKPLKEIAGLSQS